MRTTEPPIALRSGGLGKQPPGGWFWGPSMDPARKRSRASTARGWRVFSIRCKQLSKFPPAACSWSREVLSIGCFSNLPQSTPLPRLCFSNFP